MSEPTAPETNADKAIRLYTGSEHLSACVIAERLGLSAAGVTDMLLRAGIGGLQWCPVHRTHEELTRRDRGGYGR